MADDLRKLLNHIVRQYVVHDEQVGIELDATASDDGADIESDKRQAARREIERADQLADAFSRGLARARAANGQLVLDDRNPEENEEADALISFLVSHDLASSHTEETEPMHYRYFLTINWANLHAAAGAAGVDLDQAISRASRQ